MALVCGFCLKSGMSPGWSDFFPSLWNGIESEYITPQISFPFCIFYIYFHRFPTFQQCFPPHIRCARWPRGAFGSAGDAACFGSERLVEGKIHRIPWTFFLWHLVVVLVFPNEISWFPMKHIEIYWNPLVSMVFPMKHWCFSYEVYWKLLKSVVSCK